eukprot:1156955-Pelagomonas_calceolata.AAC.3
MDTLGLVGGKWGYNRDIKRRTGTSSRWEESGAQPMQWSHAQPASACTGAACACTKMHTLKMHASLRCATTCEAPKHVI